MLVTFLKAIVKLVVMIIVQVIELLVMREMKRQQAL